MKLLYIGKPNKQEFFEIIDEILNSEEYQKRKKYKHHGEKSVYNHCLSVSMKSYKIAKVMGMDYKSAAIGGLLHDFYYKPWQDNKEKTPLLKKHGFVHAKEALINSKKNYPQYMNKRVENIIVRHMFPLNITPPRYIESWVITIVDKYVSMEIFKKPSKLLMYVGIKVGEKNE